MSGSSKADKPYLWCYGLSQHMYLVLLESAQGKDMSLVQVTCASLPYHMVVRQTLNSNLERQISAFGTTCLHKIMGHRCNDCMSSKQLLIEIDMRPIFCRVHQH